MKLGKKQLLKYFDCFLQFFYPEIYAKIDWNKTPISLDKDRTYASVTKLWWCVTLKTLLLRSKLIKVSQHPTKKICQLRPFLKEFNQIDDVALLESLVVETISVNSPEDFQQLIDSQSSDND
ncbi:hypothetical protein Riv7116_6318 [Rivularia sp. PCC 7116]|uniref:hypothetical protein n=1 Tax=Rivularia sp. PCC 7116 TaxID=373994 RepID=UPI00029F3CD7|nr:hypothetical protein [Rivularia sp. PCC 7116]AFY58661.1 hypothetical protein Riv7116_6318 [Rivularia sp. PCC 7116]